ncbi:thioredoxin domain-containing protein [bacterium]|nr:thioredoxin domain-containing protein [bacterium]
MRVLMAAAALGLGVAGCSQGDAVPQSVAQMERAEVEAIVKNYLLTNPEVLSEAFDVLAKHERAKLVAELQSTEGDPVLGPPDAPITIVEFIDFNCTFCRAADAWVFEQLDDKRKDVRVIFKHLPLLEQRTGTSVAAARAAMAADKQGKYREMHLALIKTNDLSDGNIEKLAQGIGLDMAKFKRDAADAALLDHINVTFQQAGAAGVEGTPGFYINDQFIGGYDEATLKSVLRDARAAL